MSRFLAPIHTWVFNKIKIQEDLEQSLINELSKRFGTEVHSISQRAQQKYGAPLGDSSIEEVIDTDNIHGWLQGRIDIVETRLAFVLVEAIKNFGDDAKLASYEVYRRHGGDYGSISKDSYPVSAAPELYKTLNNYLLEGMPCDLVNIVKVTEEDRLEWHNIRCLHVGYWEEVNADTDLMYDLRNTWIKSFIENANQDFTYRVTAAENGEAVFINEIVRK